jgi:hypothetical protein
VAAVVTTTRHNATTHASKPPLFQIKVNPLKRPPSLRAKGPGSHPDESEYEAAHPLLRYAVLSYAGLAYRVLPISVCRATIRESRSRRCDACSRHGWRPDRRPGPLNQTVGCHFLGIASTGPIRTGRPRRRSSPTSAHGRRRVRRGDRLGGLDAYLGTWGARLPGGDLAAKVRSSTSPAADAARAPAAGGPRARLQVSEIGYTTGPERSEAARRAFGVTDYPGLTCATPTRRAGASCSTTG